MDRVRKLTDDERQLVHAAVAVLESDIDKAVRDSLRRWAARLVAAYVVLLALALLLAGLIFARVTHNDSAVAANRATTHNLQAEVARENADKVALEQATRAVAYKSCVHQNEHRAVERKILRRSEKTSRTLLTSLHVSTVQIGRTQAQTDGFIHDLADVDCNAQVGAIPVR